MNDLKNLKVFNLGIGLKNEILKVPQLNYSQPQDFGLLSLVDQHNIASFETVNIVSIDELQLPRLDFLKIDVEGMEIEVLQGARASIEKFHPWCWVEYCKIDAVLLKMQFDGLSYSFFKMDALNMLCAPHIRMTSQLHIDAPAF